MNETSISRGMKRFFTLEYWEDDGWLVGKLKEIPGVFSQGKTLEELKQNVIDAYRMMLEGNGFCNNCPL